MMQKGLSGFRRFLDVVETEPEITNAPDAELLDDVKGDVNYENVFFHYSDDDTPVLENVSFHIPAGKSIALVGPSGEGKTTMIRLILGLIHPEKGEAYLRASNGKQVEMNADTRHLFAYVPQGNTILSGTIAENLRMVKQDATEEEMIEALKISCAWDFVKNMEETIYTKIGERGRRISEGQAQRIAIARAVFKRCTDLIVR